MREIKFRAWTKMGFIYKSLPSRGYMSPPEVGSPQPICWQQYTGLKDKNGVEIYEGDVVEFSGRKYEVYWASLSGYFDAKEVTSNRQKRYINDAVKAEGFKVVIASEVIGNIYENPELLNDNQQ